MNEPREFRQPVAWRGDRPAPARRARRAVLCSLAALGATLLVPRAAIATAASRIEVWKSPTCGCCTGWVEHLQAAGFAVVVHDVGNAAARKRLGMPAQFGSCHTAAVGGYAIEGHVPAPDIVRLLEERPQALGLAVPGMPVGSPGMEMGDQRDPYDVLLVQRDGSSRVWRSVR
ncbi:MAG TPA: DUF411 domain-containing protein [Burkholderiaceae bacterium]|nr:DUF411 domain-containing protein [Burkholderiaceae bacterium]